MAEPHSTQRPQNPRCESLEVAFRLPPGSLQVSSLEVLQTCLTGCVLTSKHQHCHHRQCKRPQLYATSFKVNETFCALTVQAVFRSFNLPSWKQKPNRGFHLVAEIRKSLNWDGGGCGRLGWLGVGGGSWIGSREDWAGDLGIGAADKNWP